MPGKVLIVYSTRTGINEEVAVAMADVLKTSNFDVTVKDLKDGSPDIVPFQGIIVGAGVKGTSVYDEAIDFLAKDFDAKQVALYFSCEDYENPKVQSTEENKRKALAKNKSLKPVDVAAFGGCKISGGRPLLDDLNMSRVRDWTMELGKKFDTESQMPQSEPSCLLNSVPPENVFRFFTNLETNTGMTASSTVDFGNKLQVIPLQSVMFHFEREDFQRWFRDSVGDVVLAMKIDDINLWDQGEDLRKALLTAVQNRISEISQPSKPIST